MRYICSICGYVYDEAGNVPFAELPADWKCPLCGASKSDFAPEGVPEGIPESGAAPEAAAEMRPLSALETGALCSSLAKGCEKQYLPDQAAAFRKLADWFTAQERSAADPSFDKLLELLNADLGEGFPAAVDAAIRNGDRGARRSLTWSEKVTRILRSLLTRYAEEGDAMLENTGVYMCTVCGFVYVGSELPEVCPVCKVPNRKFEKIGG